MGAETINDLWYKCIIMAGDGLPAVRVSPSSDFSLYYPTRDQAMATFITGWEAYANFCQKWDVRSYAQQGMMELWEWYIYSQGNAWPIIVKDLSDMEAFAVAMAVAL